MMVYNFMSTNYMKQMLVVHIWMEGKYEAGVCQEPGGKDEAEVPGVRQISQFGG